ncbi:MAG: hypothetical protein JW982_02680 [Spirochaetes bacterium]|nr:hypothetical protein [Spirochaetota bacterium]
MKKAFDAAERHQGNYHINSFNGAEVSKYNFGFLNKKYDTVSDSSTGEYSSELIKDVYVSSGKTKAGFISGDYHSCFASDFSFFVLDLIENNYVAVNEDGCLDNAFYDFVSAKGSLIAEIYGVNDPELVKIFTKQLILILKSMDHLDLSLGRAKVTSAFTGNDFTLSLFRTFWNNISWAELFPSLPELAVSLQKNRNVLSGMLLNSQYPVHLEQIGFDFLIKSNVRLRNEMLLISFLDFSVFSWLNLFGFIKYLDQNCDRCVMIDMTDYGRETFSAL